MKKKIGHLGLYHKSNFISAINPTDNLCNTPFRWYMLLYLLCSPLSERLPVSQVMNFGKNHRRSWCNRPHINLNNRFPYNFRARRSLKFKSQLITLIITSPKLLCWLHNSISAELLEISGFWCENMYFSAIVMLFTFFYIIW